MYSESSLRYKKVKVLALKMIDSWCSSA